MTTTLLPSMDYFTRSLNATVLALRLRESEPSAVTTAMSPCRGSPEGVFGDPPTSLRFQIDGPALWFKTTAQGNRSGWINLSAGGGGGGQNWAQVLATGASSGANDPIVEAGQALFFGDVAVGQTVAGDVDIGGNVIPGGAVNLGDDTNRWDIVYLNHLVGLYVDNLPTGTTLDNQYVIDVTNGDDLVLPTAAENGSMYIVRNRDGVLTSTITPQAGQTIEGAPSLVLNPGNTFLLVADGTTVWRAIAMATGGGVVTLQAAITNQGAVPTTQITNTNIELGDGTGWIYADAVGNPVVGIFGDDNANAFTVQGGVTVANAGQGVSIAAGSATAGGQDGGAVSILAGAGSTTGSGGAMLLRSGAAGATGSSGIMSLATPAGGATSGASGDLNVTTGNTTDGITGGITIRTGDARGTDRAAGDIAITGGSSTGSAEGADINVTGGPGELTGSGGDIALTGGVAGTTADGGTVSITTGAGGGVSGASGDLTLATGTTTDGSTGAITMSTANALGTNRAAGDITLLGGSSTGTAEGADVNITAGAGGTSGTGGDLGFTAGAGGTTAQGGLVLIAGGAGGSTSGAGGDVSIAGGTATDGNGGDVGLAGGAAVGTNRTGGELTLVAGASTGNAISAPITLQAGTSSGTGTGGRISLIAGDGAVGGSGGGNINLVGGAASGAANDGGSVSVAPGAATGAGTNGRLSVTPGWAGDGRMIDLVGNGANSGTISVHSGSRAGGPNGTVASSPGSFYGYNGSGSAIAGAGYLNTGTTASSTVWEQIVTSGSALLSLAGLPGNAYASLVGYIDASDRNSYAGSGAVVRDIMGNGSAGALTAPAVLTEGAFAFNGASGSVSLTKNASLNNIFAAGGTVLAFIRPASDGEGDLGRVADTTQSADAGWYLSSFSDAASRQSIQFQRNFSGSVGGTWNANNITSPVSGASVRPVDLGTWSCVAVTYNDSNVANDPTFYVNGDLVANTEANAPVGAAVTDAGNALFIGNRSADDFTFNGQIGVVLLFTRVLTQNEIRTIYNDFGRRYGLGQSGWTSTVERGQSVYIIAGSTSQASSDADGGDVLIRGGDTSAGASAPDGGSIVIRSGDVTGITSGRPGNLTVLSGGVTSSGSGATSSSAEFGCGVHGNGNAAGTCTIHGGDNSADGNGGNMIVRGGDCITATATSDSGGNLGLRAGISRNGSAGGDAFLASGGVGGTGTGSTTGDITISTQRTALGPFAQSGGNDTDTGNISILTTNPGSTADSTGNITIQCGNVAATTGANPGDIAITAGSATNTTQANATAGNITLTAGLNAGQNNSLGGSVTLIGGASSGTGATTGTGGDIVFTGGANAHNSAASRGGNIQGTAGAGTGTNTSGGSVSFTAGASTGTGTAGSAALVAGAGAAAAAGGTVIITAGAGGGTSGTGGQLSITAGAGGGSGSGGAVTVSGGAAGATGAAGGTVTVQGGAATDGNGGGVILTGRNGTGTNRSGGSIQISTGDATGSGTGGGLVLLGGSGGTTGTAGSVTITAGAGGSTSGTGGSTTVQGGLPVDGNGGGVSIIGRAGVGTNRAGGVVAITAGVATGNGAGGHINLTPGTAGSTAISGMVRSLGAVAYAAPVSPAALAAGDTNNYNPAGGTEANVLRVTPDAVAGSGLTGLVGGAGRDGRALFLMNVGANVLTLRNDNAGSTDINRFFLPAATLVIAVNGGVMLLYDETSQRWRVVIPA